MAFKDTFWAEWRRLNPRFCKDDDNFRQSFRHALHEGWIGWWAPARMAWWLLLGRWRG